MWVKEDSVLVGSCHWGCQNSEGGQWCHHILKGEKEKTSCCGEWKYTSCQCYSEWKDIYIIKSVKCNA